MKKGFFLMLGLFLFASVSFAVNFLPTKMVISAPKVLQYNFDGSLLKIPMTVSGVGGTGVLAVFTKDQAASIKQVTNGFMGWHYVNKIDTSIFISPVYQFPVGGSTIMWDGKDENGKAVAPGTYTYYLFAFDSVDSKVRVTKVLHPAGYTAIEEKGQDGKQLANPIIRSPSVRWVIGSDPLDTSLKETTKITLPTGWRRSTEPTVYGGNSALLPTDFKTEFLGVGNKESVTQGIAAYTWVPNGAALLKTEWAEKGMAVFHLPGDLGDQAGVTTDGKYLYTVGQNYYLPIAFSDFYIYDFDGTLIKHIDLTTWWSNPDDLAKKGQMNGGPNFISQKNGYVFLNSHTSCLKQMVDPVAALTDEEDFIVWTNKNGDFFFDHNELKDSPHPWVCFDYNVAPECYKVDADANGFTALLANYIGAVSFGLMAPDGTKVGYFAYAGETANRWAAADFGRPVEKGGTMFIQNGSAYDGIYADNWCIPDSLVVEGTWYVGHDSVKGVLSKEVKVSENTPVSFAVAQNVPNPFNPSTTIRFTLQKAGRVTVEVFNVAGQKVDTIVNASMSAGTHSVTWNASKFSAGMYFYTVRSGDSARTMKMTLMK